MIFLLVILVILIIFVIFFLVWYFSHSDKLGQTCTEQSQCGTGLVCVNTGTSSAPAFTCKAGYHSTCTGGTTSTDCAPGLTCGTNGTCIPLPQTTPTNRNSATSNGGNRNNTPVTSSTNKTPRSGWMAPKPVAQPRREPPAIVSGQPILIDNRQEHPKFEASASESSSSVSDNKNYIDMCSYSNMTLALHNDGRIVVQPAGSPSYYVNNNIKLKRIFSYCNYLTGLAEDGIIVWLEQDQVKGHQWQWKRYSNFPENITSCSVTLNQECLWLHDSYNSQGYLYKGINMIEQKMQYKYRRVYGLDQQTYLEIDERSRTATVHPTGQQFTDVYDAVIEYPDKIAIITGDQRNLYNGMAIVNWKAMYINKWS